MLKVIGVGKEYKDKVALFDVNLTFPDKGLVIIKGESGSGKTTLLNLLSANDYPTSGFIEFDGVEINSKNSENFRRKYCSNIYQDYMLIEDLSVGENVELAMQAYGKSYTLESIKHLLRKVGMPEDYLIKQVSKLSGGEKQRVAIARAIAKENAIIFADEPTGNLDSKNGELIMDILKEISHDRLVVVVSHNDSFNVKYADNSVELVDGVVENCDLYIENEVKVKEKTPNTFKSNSKFRVKTIFRIAFWGFKKNKMKTIVSLMAFGMLCIFSLLFAVVAFSDLNLAYTYSLDKCESKNFVASIDNSYKVTYDVIRRFEDNFSNECAEVYATYYQFYNGEEDDEQKDKFIKRYHYFIPNIELAILYNEDIGGDFKVLYGDFPKENDDVMLPYCYIRYLSQIYNDYKTDNIENLVGKIIKYGRDIDNSIDFRICGIFEEGSYFTDFDKPQNEDIIKYYYDTNKMARAAIFSSEVKEIWCNDAKNSGIVDMPDFSVKDSSVQVYGYDRYREYAKEYLPLADGEVYISKSLAQAKNISVGDTLADTKYDVYNLEMNKIEHKNFDGFVVKDIIDATNTEKFVIFSSSYFMNTFIKGKDLNSFKGFYFNMKDIKDVYGFLNKIKNVGIQSKIWWDTLDTYYVAYAENINIAPKFYDTISIYKYLVFLPLTVVSLVGLAAMGFVSTSYLISSKGNSYNIMRSIGFGKKEIAMILALQVFALIVAGCVLGISTGALCCHLFDRMYIKSHLGSAVKVATEVILPMGYIAPIIVTAVAMLIGVAVVTAKTILLFRKSIAQNKQSE